MGNVNVSFIELNSCELKNAECLQLFREILSKKAYATITKGIMVKCQFESMKT